MKKLLFAFMMVFSAISFQNAEAQFLQVGVRGGLNYPTISGIEAGTYTGFHAGTYFRMNALGLISVEPGVQYSQKGFRAGESSPMGAATDRLHYIDVPVLLRITVFPLVNIFAGPQASYLVGRNYNGSTSFTTTDNLRDYDLSGVVGIGLSLPLGFNLQGSYDFGLSSIEYDGMDTRHNVVKISLGKNF
ncbi:PorT family protein [Litoribacter ruber]|uniref:PorT family protein n=1 Tax=Litoribacter ruber TaxID=702568 RepID=A0AAP2G3Y8_9BACT|nr:MULTISPECIES: porin family protein [Litoribacter]MBS9522923.1 PorT family protein [Litoribacter alkaliphilus]MBT0810930.1 PorT family protein [Litoribacter ruber]